jgi:hypothetical protein
VKKLRGRLGNPVHVASAFTIFTFFGVNYLLRPAQLRLRGVDGEEKGG